MICSSCHQTAHHIKVIEGIEICESCGGFSVAGGTKTDGLLTRNSFRIRSDSVKHEGDTLPPHEYDKHSRRIKPREDFIKQFPEQASETFCREELDRAGYKKLKTKKTCPIKDDIEYHGNQNKRLKELI